MRLDDLFGSETENARSAGDGVMRIGAGDQDRAPGRRQSLFPHPRQHHVAGRQQGGQVGERSAVRGEAGERPRRPADFRAELLGEHLFHGGDKRPHFVDRHDLIRDRSQGIEQTGQRNRRRDLVSDVAGMMQILSARQDESGQFLEAVRDFLR